MFLTFTFICSYPFIFLMLYFFSFLFTTDYLSTDSIYVKAIGYDTTSNSYFMAMILTFNPYPSNVEYRVSSY
jgi:hypothetical protein